MQSLVVSAFIWKAEAGFDSKRKKNGTHKIHLQLGCLSRLEYLTIMHEALGSVLSTSEKVLFFSNLLTYF